MYQHMKWERNTSMTNILKTRLAAYRELDGLPGYLISEDGELFLLEIGEEKQ